MSETYPDDFIMSPKIDLVFKELMTNKKVRKRHRHKRYKAAKH